jgi:hypothetical protein
MPSPPLLPIFRLLPSKELRFVPIRRIDPAARTPQRHWPFAIRTWQRPAPRVDSNQMPS